MRANEALQATAKTGARLSAKPLGPRTNLWSNGLVRDFRAGRLVPVLSDVTAAEVEDAPAPVRELHQEILLLAGGVLPVTAEVDALVSWNFKHIVRLEQIRLFNAVNADLGHKALSILSPREVTTYEGD